MQMVYNIIKIVVPIECSINQFLSSGYLVHKKIFLKTKLF